MTDPTTPDTLTAAAERAETHRELRQRLGAEAAERFVREARTGVCMEYRHDRCAYGKNPEAMTCLCECHDEPLAAPTSAVDREGLAIFVANAISRSSQQHVPVGYRVADALISSGHVTRARLADREDGAAQEGGSQ